MNDIVLTVLGISMLHPLQVAMPTGNIPDPDEVVNAAQKIQYVEKTSTLPNRVVIGEAEGESLPPVGNQGNTNACTSWSVTYCALSYGRARNLRIMKNLDKPENQFSAAFNHYMKRQFGTLRSLNDGWFAHESIDAVIKYGCPTVKDYPFPGYKRIYDLLRDNYPLSEAPPGAVMETAQKNKIRPESVTRITTWPEVDEISLKGWLANYRRPVVLGMSLPSTFPRLDSFRVDDSYTFDYNGTNPRANGHAMAIVGYDSERDGYLVQNSWGDWGNKGRFWLSSRALRILTHSLIAFLPTGARAMGVGDQPPLLKGFKLIPGSKSVKKQSAKEPSTLNLITGKPPANNGKRQGNKDLAIIIGINRYSKLIEDFQLEGGINSSKLIKNVLSSHGFSESEGEVIELNSGLTNKSDILSALSVAKTKGKIARFVFYYCGHGRTIEDLQEGAICPSDTNMNSPEFDVTTSEIFNAVKQINADSRTVILDSCFAGAMVRTKGGILLGRGRPLGLPPVRRDGSIPQSKEITLDDTEEVIKVIPVSSGPPICYFVASRANQYAYEDQFPDGAWYGYFSAAMNKHLTPSTPSWSAVSSFIENEVSRQSDDRQHPVLLSNYLSAKPFGPAVATPIPKKKSISLAELYATDRFDSNKLKAAILPSKSTFFLTQQDEGGLKSERWWLEIENEIPASQLLVLERDTDLNLNMIYPDPRITNVKKLGGLNGFGFTKGGDERLKVMRVPPELQLTVLSAFESSASKNKSGFWSMTLAKAQTVNLDGEFDLNKISTKDFHFEAVVKK